GAGPVPSQPQPSRYPKVHGAVHVETSGSEFSSMNVRHMPLQGSGSAFGSHSAPMGSPSGRSSSGTHRPLSKSHFIPSAQWKSPPHVGQQASNGSTHTRSSVSHTSPLAQSEFLVHALPVGRARDTQAMSDL